MNRAENIIEGTLSRKFRYLMISVLASLIVVSTAGADNPFDIDRESLHWRGDNWELTFLGMLRHHLSLNLEDIPETSADDQYDFSISRITFQPELEGRFGEVEFRFQPRIAREYDLDYLEQLENPESGGPFTASNLTDDLYDVDEIRDFYIDFKPSNNTTVRFGRQQVSFGETDFFQAMDIVHGFDFTWRSFLEPENEELRKPLNMLNITQDFPDADGALQVLLIPGKLNRKQDFGTDFDVFGGRWATQPNRGTDFTANDLVPFNRDHSEADSEDFKGAIRWTGLWNDINLQIAYLHQHNLEPVVNSVFVPFEETPRGILGDFIYPIVDVVGFSASVYSVAADAVFSTEIAYTIDKPFNVGSDPSVCGAPFPGFCGIAEEDTVKLMLRMDKVADFTQTWFNSSRPGFLSFQLFDEYVPGLSSSDDLVATAGFAAKKEEHNVIGTFILNWNYLNDRINPGLAGGYDFTGGGGFFIPSIEFAWGNSIRLRLEADLFFDEDPLRPGELDSSETTLIDYFANNNQFLMRLTYQW